MVVPSEMLSTRRCFPLGDAFRTKRSTPKQKGNERDSNQRKRSGYRFKDCLTDGSVPLPFIETRHSRNNQLATRDPTPWHPGQPLVRDTIHVQQQAVCEEGGGELGWGVFAPWLTSPKAPSVGSRCTCHSNGSLLLTLNASAYMASRASSSIDCSSA